MAARPGADAAFCWSIRAIAGGAPALLGEFGIIFDLDDGQAFAPMAAGERTPDAWGLHSPILDIACNAIDALRLHSTQWHYPAGNRSDLHMGDGWKIALEGDAFKDRCAIIRSESQCRATRPVRCRSPSRGT
jgi:hypothetical protein